ncbi:heme/steroid binding protein [Ascosphaera apis ARSEF 7405]|uniref:Heme/steroid binding protein n=1 Tax=Ascosphaera apis ARSEF 7405 TaxID=392613 RepID=A0A166ND38_9EURO|nr:heme/steroid binding protein [Ascosphaera apis ARSEF 7405]
MVWTGVAALVATFTFLIYKHPVSTWETHLGFASPIFAWWRRRQTQDDHNLPPDSAPENPGHEAEGIPAEKIEHSINETGMEDDAAEHTSSEERTPKAKPADSSCVATISEIPTFELKDCSSTPTSASASASTPATVPESSKFENVRPQTQQVEAAQPRAMPPPSLPPSIKPPTSGPNFASSSSSLTPPPGRGSLMPPPPRPTGGTLRPPASAASSLRAPMNRSSTVGTLSPRPGRLQSSRSVPLEPGHSPLDWAALTSNPKNSQRLRGDDVPADTYLRVTPAMLKAHNGRKGTNAWTSYMGKVYNITPYIPFHPGGKGELLRCAGKDAARLFNEVHPWVNWDGMLGECLVGILVSDNDAVVRGNSWEEMD